MIYDNVKYEVAYFFEINDNFPGNPRFKFGGPWGYDQCRYSIYPVNFLKTLNKLNIAGDEIDGILHQL